MFSNPIIRNLSHLNQVFDALSQRPQNNGREIQLLRTSAFVSAQARETVGQMYSNFHDTADQNPPKDLVLSLVKELINATTPFDQQSSALQEKVSAVAQKLEGTIFGPEAKQLNATMQENRREINLFARINHLSLDDLKRV